MELPTKSAEAEQVNITVSHAPLQKGVSKLFRDEYAEKQRKCAALMPEGSYPDVEIRYENLSYILNLPNTTVNREIKTVPRAFFDLVMTPVTLARKMFDRASGATSSSTQPFVVLDKISGVLKPGSVSLLLTPPGHGKTSYLRALAGRLPPSKLSGSVSFGGMAPEEAAARGLYVKQLVHYVDQLDTHLPELTVRETFEFANQNGTVDPTLLHNSELEKAAAERVEDVIKLLSLQTCANTIVGNDLLRGVSGGEKKRVTIGESMVTNARVLLMDEISTGLDSSVTYDIVSAIRSWAKATNGTVVIALLQPTPEVYSLFDDVIMLREGAVLYHGARTALPDYLSSLKYFPPASSAAGGAEANKVDMADWLVEFLTHPSHAWKTGYTAALKEGRAEEGLDYSNVPVTTQQLVAAWSKSQGKAEMDRHLALPPAPLQVTSEFAKKQYCRPYPRTVMQHFASLLGRQWKLTSRNKLFISFRVFSAIFMAIILGTVFYQIPIDKGADRFGMFLFGAMHVAFSNFSEVPIAVVNKYICYKHVASGMYPSLGYVLAGSLLHIPIAAAESLVFSAILYFMVGLVAEPGRFFFFFFTLFMVDLAMAGLFRIFAYGFPDMETAQVAPGPIISIQMLFAGFLITRNKMSWLLFMHYISIFGYALRSLAQNEFLADAYNLRPVANGPTLGEIYLSYFDFQTEIEWKWGGIGFIAFFAIFTNIIGGIVLGKIRIERNIGTSRGKDAEIAATSAPEGVKAEQQSNDNGAEEALRIDASVAEGDDRLTAAAENMPPMSPMSPNPALMSPAPVDYADVIASPPAALPPSLEALEHTTTASVMPFQPMTVVFQDIHYTVPIAAKTTGSIFSGNRKVTPATTKVLLQGVTGYAAPKTLTALMGASGAGKTTLLDVIAGRKNSGVMRGEIRLNGFPKEQKSFARLTAYVEQMDIHSPLATVRESLEFSAALRLPASVTLETRGSFVAEVLQMLELTDIADRKIGEVGAADGLSPGQRKRLTIGVELVSNAPIIFLDEPTTGLDSRAAAVVIRVIKKIAESGRTVITTIHQPSADLFFMFDNLLLLQRGGYQVYMGPVGERGSSLVRYIEGIPGTPRCPKKMNPASWMLDVLAGTDSSGDSGHKGHQDGSDNQHAANPLALAPASAPLVHQASGFIVRSESKGRGQLLDIPEGAIDHSRAPPSDKSTGPVDYQAIFRANHGDRLSKTLENLGSPVPGTSPVSFESVYARGFWYQYATILGRNNRSYLRNIDYNFVRIMTLLGLLILFGVIYYKLTADDLGGVQSLVSVMFMTTAFIGLLNMNVALPVMIKERAVFYRERFSYLYGPTAYGLASITIELPWLLLLVFVCVPVIYFMVGFNASASAFFFYLFVVWVFTVVFISMGQFAAALFPGIEIAQAVVGLVIPVLFLFGGLFLREPSIPAGWRWLHYADPIKYALNALVTPQFYCEGADCPSITYLAPSGQVTVDRFSYVQDAFGLQYDRRWHDIAYLVIFVAGFQVIHFLCLKFVSHIKR